MLLQPFPHSGNRTSGTDTGYKYVYRTIGIVPDFLGGCPAVNIRIRRILELLGNEGIRYFGRQLLGLADRTRHAFGGLGQHQLRSELLQQLPAL
ncbi:hypothetical protein D3C71_1465340 [compost metagenome]